MVAEVRAAGYGIGNIDATVICERPRIGGRIREIRERLAGIMGVDVNSLSVKGKSNERMDDIGAGMGIAVHAVSLLTAG